MLFLLLSIVVIFPFFTTFFFCLLLFRFICAVFSFSPFYISSSVSPFIPTFTHSLLFSIVIPFSLLFSSFTYCLSSSFGNNPSLSHLNLCFLLPWVCLLLPVFLLSLCFPLLYLTHVASLTVNFYYFYLFFTNLFCFLSHLSIVSSLLYVFRPFFHFIHFRPLVSSILLSFSFGANPSYSFSPSIGLFPFFHQFLFILLFPSSDSFLFLTHVVSLIVNFHLHCLSLLIYSSASF